VIARSDDRPSAEAVRALLPTFTGCIEQVPPRYSAIKIEGERAYDLARDGETVELPARPVEIGRLELADTYGPDHALLEAECGKGTYVRSLARDLGRALGCFGHVSALRRAAVGPFGEETMILLEQLEAVCHRAATGEASLADARCPLRPRWTTSRRWPLAGRCGKASARPSRFVARTGRTQFPRHNLRHGIGPDYWPWPNWIVAKSSPSASSTSPA
jgi:Pseudouridine synthase